VHCTVTARWIDGHSTAAVMFCGYSANGCNDHQQGDRHLRRNVIKSLMSRVLWDSNVPQTCTSNGSSKTSSGPLFHSCRHHAIEHLIQREFPTLRLILWPLSILSTPTRSRWSCSQIMPRFIRLYSTCTDSDPLFKIVQAPFLPEHWLHQCLTIDTI